VVGGSDERARKLRQAIAIAVDFEEFVSIFANGEASRRSRRFRPVSSATVTARRVSIAPCMTG